VHRSGALPAAGAQADDFNGLAFDTETDRSGTGDYGLADHRLLQLDGRMALAADQELALVGKLRLIAADEGVERGNAVDQAVFQKEIQCTVDRRWRRATTVFLAQYGEDVIGAQRLVALPDQFQHPFAQGGQAQAVARTDALRFGQSVADCLAEQRLSRAARDLTSSDRPVSVVGYDAGDLNNASFARAFTRRYGLCPSDYRRAGGQVALNAA